jgi:hypothetical protein
MAVIKQNVYQTIATVLTTELNSLATGSAASASSAQGADATAADLLLDFELLTGGSITPGTNPRADLYLIRAADGTNYEDSTTGASESLPPDAFVGSFVPTSGAGTKRMVLRDRPAPPGLWKAIVLNELGVSLAASGNTLKVRPHSYQTV